jgi:uncharacterized membrane-anchored protein
MRAAVIFAGLALPLLAVAGLVVQKEQILRDGKPVLLELAPVDPRSLVQGDYMRLDYAVSARNVEPVDDRPVDGKMVLRLDEQGVGQFVRFHTPGTPVGPSEHLLRYRIRGGRVRLGAEAFFFQEGQAERYDGAKYGELRLTEDGNSVLVGLRDEERRPLGGEHTPARTLWR